MAITNVSDRVYTVTSADDGNFLSIGNADEGRVGCWLVQLNVQPGFAGSFTVMGVSFGKQASDAAFPPIPIPYRRVNVAGVASDYGIVTDPITDSGMFLIPASGISVSLLTACPLGSSATLTSWPLTGSTGV